MDQGKSTRKGQRRGLNTSFVGLFLVTLMIVFQNCGRPFQPATLSSSSIAGSLDDGPLPSQKCSSSGPIPKAAMQRLTNQEYIYTIKDLFAVDVSASALPTTDVPGLSGFSTDAERMNQPSVNTENVARGYFLLSFDVAEKVMAEQPLKVLGLACNQQTTKCYDDMINALALRLFRRPLDLYGKGEERASYGQLFQSQSTFEKGAKLVLASMLSSPNFLYKTFGSFSTSPNRTLNSYEIASRLAFLTWSSSPDIALLNSDLRNAKVLDAQLDRVLSDAKSARLASGFGNEWLKYANAAETEIPAVYGINERLPASAVAETNAFINHVFTKSDRVLDLYNAKYSFLDETLANHYKVSGVTGSGLRYVANVGAERGGILSQASILMNTAGEPMETHPVVRGLWVVNEIMCQVVPDPPEGVDTTPDIDARNPKEFAEIHRSDPQCMGCHALMDPIGLGLENYDPMGQWRSKYEIGPTWGGKNIAVEPNGILQNQAFKGPDELRTLISQNPSAHKCMSNKILSFGFGRRPQPRDACLGESLAKDVIAKGGSFKDILRAIVTSDNFQFGGEQ